MNELKIESEVFDSMRKDFNSIIDTTVRRMMDKHSYEAAISLKLSVAIVEDRHIDTEYDTGVQIITRPEFDYKITSVMQVKDKAEGSVDRTYELVNGRAGELLLLPIGDGQLMFNTGGEE